MSDPRGISGNGKVVVGSSSRWLGEALRWTAATGPVILRPSSNELPDADGHVANAASFDGSVIAGTTWAFPTPTSVGTILVPWRWTAASGITRIALEHGSDDPATDISHDGSAISTMRGVWDQRRGVTRPPLTRFGREVNAISSSGRVYVGATYTINGDLAATRWTARTRQLLASGASGVRSSIAQDVSDDGIVVVGRARRANRNEAFRWTKKSGMVGLGDLPGGAFESEAVAVSGDGSIVVGMSVVRGGEAEPFWWTKRGGMRRLEDVLEDDFGLDLAGWDLDRVVDISSDGKVILGVGAGPDGDEGWLVNLRPSASHAAHASPAVSVPEPAGIALVALALALTTRRRRRMRD